MQVQDRSNAREEVKQPYLYQGSQWKWGFTPSAEIWNGRLAMLGFLIATLIELFTGHGYLRVLGLLSGTDIAP
jgi:heme oxygenase